IENVFKLAEKEFELKYPNIKLVANCWLETESFTFNQKEKRRVVRQIVDYIFGLTQNVNIEKPDFLCYVDISDHNGVSFSFNGDISNIKSLDSQTLSNAIIKKEALIEKYINNCGIQEQWLILVVGQTSPDSYKINESVLNSTDSSFERIYLFEDFKSKKYRLK
ncbi:MAG: hypothetical protein IMZ58_12580, partial [Thermoplasmata archaeon]|nr:hypothetical protein [Thermoplasmata archaeon]